MSFFFTRKYRFLKNKRLILFLCNEYIDKLEKDSHSVSCKEDLMKKISSHIDEYQSDFATYTERSNDFHLVVKSMVCTDSFELVTSGKYNLLGVLNTTGPAKNLIRVHKLAVKDALDAGLITKEEYDEDLLALQEGLSARL